MCYFDSFLLRLQYLYDFIFSFSSIVSLSFNGMLLVLVLLGLLFFLVNLILSLVTSCLLEFDRYVRYLRCLDIEVQDLVVFNVELSTSRSCTSTS